MAILSFLSINRAMEVYMLVLFWRDCLQMLVFKDLGGLLSKVLSFSIVRKDFKGYAFLEEDSAGEVYVGFVSFKFISFFTDSVRTKFFTQVLKSA